MSDFKLTSLGHCKHILTVLHHSQLADFKISYCVLCFCNLLLNNTVYELDYTVYVNTQTQWLLGKCFDVCFLSTINMT